MKTSGFFRQLTVVTILTAALEITHAQQAKNVVIADFISTEDLYQQASFPYASQMSLADLWGWTYNGEEYALVCLLGSFQGNGLSMVKVTDPNKATIIKTIRRGRDRYLKTIPRTSGLSATTPTFAATTTRTTM